MMRLEYRALQFALMIGLAGAPACGGSDSDAKPDSGPKKDAAADADDDDDSYEDSGTAHDSGTAMDADTKPQDAASDTSKSDGATADSATADAGGDSGAGSAPTCAEYCTKIMANCTTTKAQYPSSAVCMAVCTSFPLGATADTSGNTLGCRLYHAGAAAADSTTHCNHAGLTGGDKDPTDTNGGPCGEGCDAFCNEAQLACTTATSPGGTAPYATKEACMTECKTFTASANTFSTADTSGDSFNCRAYHLTAASKTPDPHCGHIKKVSSTCK